MSGQFGSNAHLIQLEKDGEIERLHRENESLKRSLLYIAERRESNQDWTVAHNALAVYGRPRGAY